MCSLVLGCAVTSAQASGVYLNRRWFPSLAVGCLASLTMPVRVALSLSRHSRRQISDSRRAEAIAKSTMAAMGIVARRSRRLKCSRSRSSSSAVGRRVRFRGLPTRRSSRCAGASNGASARAGPARPATTTSATTNDDVLQARDATTRSIPERARLIAASSSGDRTFHRRRSRGSPSRIGRALRRVADASYRPAGHRGS